MGPESFGFKGAKINKSNYFPRAPIRIYSRVKSLNPIFENCICEQKNIYRGKADFIFASCPQKKL
jgi:hypothetical protein